MTSLSRPDPMSRAIVLSELESLPIPIGVALNVKLDLDGPLFELEAVFSGLKGGHADVVMNRTDLSPFELRQAVRRLIAEARGERTAPVLPSIVAFWNN